MADAPTPATPSTAKTRRTGDDRVPVRANVRREVAERLKKEANDRVVGEALLVERGIEMLLDSLPPLDATLAPREPS